MARSGCGSDDTIATVQAAYPERWETSRRNLAGLRSDEMVEGRGARPVWAHSATSPPRVRTARRPRRHPARTNSSQAAPQATDLLSLPRGSWPPSWTARWWRQQRSSQLARLVSPPRDQGVRWWTSHQPGGRSHPAATQPRSRTTSARHNADGMVRVLRPTSIGSDRPWVITREMPASHDRRSSVATESRPVCSASARTCATSSWPARPSRTSTSITVLMWGRLRRPGPLRGAFGTDPAAFDQCVGPPLRSRARITSGACGFHGCFEGVDDDLAAFGVEHPVDRHHAIEGR